MYKKVETEEQRMQVMRNEMISFMSNRIAYKNHEKYISKENTYGWFEGGQLRSSLSIYPYLAKLNEGTIPVWGIGHVATFPEYRGNGYFKKLMKSVLRDAAENEVPVVSLYPYSYELYRKIGFIELYWTKTVQVLLSDIKNVDIGCLRAYTPEYQKNIHNVYSSYISKRNGCEIRDIEYWNRQSENMPIYLYVGNDTEESVSGYVSFDIISPHDGMEKIIDIKEIIFDSEATLLGILSQLKKWGPRVSVVRWELSEEKNLPKILHNMKQQFITSKIATMFRVVDVKKAMKNWHINVNSLQTILRINDSFCEWNAVTLSISFTNGNLDFYETNDIPEIEMSIEAFTQMLFGAIDYDEAQQHEGIHFVRNVSDRLKPLFQKRTIEMFDSF